MRFEMVDQIHAYAASIAHVLNVTATTVENPDAVASATASQAPHTGLALLLDQIEYGIMVPMVYFAILFCLVFIIIRLITC